MNKLILSLLVFLITPLVHADIFAKSGHDESLQEALRADIYGAYYKAPLDYNAFAESQSPFSLERSGISLGCQRFNMHESLKNMIQEEELNHLEMTQAMTKLSTASLMLWQYSSPTLADLFKHQESKANERLKLRYQQCEDVENTLQDPLIILRKQAVLDCLKQQDSGHGMQDINEAMKECLERNTGLGILAEPYATLKDPERGQSYIHGEVNVSQKTLNRVNFSRQDLSLIEDLLPQIWVSPDSVRIESPRYQSREVMAVFREEFLTSLKEILENYQRTHEFDQALLDNLSVFGVPLTETQLRHLAMMEGSLSLIYLSKMASYLAYLKTMDQYTQASQWLDLIMKHPAIQPGYKNLIRSNVDYVKGELTILHEEKMRLGEYAKSMEALGQEAFQMNEETRRWLEEEKNKEASIELLKLR